MISAFAALLAMQILPAPGTGDAYGAGDTFLRSRDEPAAQLVFEPIEGNAALETLRARVCGGGQ